MRNIILLFALVFMFGCLTDVNDSEGSSYKEYVVVEDSAGLYGPSNSDYGYNKCVSQILEYYLPDGSYHTLILPGLCSNFYFDNGDPPPEYEYLIRHIFVYDPMDPFDFEGVIKEKGYSF